MFGSLPRFKFYLRGHTPLAGILRHVFSPFDKGEGTRVRDEVRSGDREGTSRLVMNLACEGANRGQIGTIASERNRDGGLRQEKTFEFPGQLVRIWTNSVGVQAGMVQRS